MISYANGQGKMEFPNGDFYEGEYEDGLKSGKGTYVHSSAKARYDG